MAAVSTAGVTMISTKLSHNHRQNGRASGQNRRKTSRTLAAGAASTKPPVVDVGRSSDLNTSRTTTPLPDLVLGPALGHG
jgi:hypothetical protein